jgi:hypothetical protein
MLWQATPGLAIRHRGEHRDLRERRAGRRSVAAAGGNVFGAIYCDIKVALSAMAN